MSKKALIITDGSEPITNIAKLISDALGLFTVNIRTAENFEGTDILPVDVFFIGCNEPSPASFAYLQDMLSHINLASRKCGVFSVNEKSLNYLCSIVSDCDAGLGAPLFVKSKIVPVPALENWVKGIIN
ncbi:MAG: hypothetical protein FWD28_04000 [Treponema sp.]|nr:hypothetical protein [Treponema sp.]